MGDVNDGPPVASALAIMLRWMNRPPSVARATMSLPSSSSSSDMDGTRTSRWVVNVMLSPPSRLSHPLLVGIDVGLGMGRSGSDRSSMSDGRQSSSTSPSEVSSWGRPDGVSCSAGRHVIGEYRASPSSGGEENIVASVTSVPQKEIDTLELLGLDGFVPLRTRTRS